MRQGYYISELENACVVISNPHQGSKICQKSIETEIFPWKATKVHEASGLYRLAFCRTKVNQEFQEKRFIYYYVTAN